MNESGTIKSFDGLKLFFQKQGCGPAVLMVHGACVDSDCFEPLAALLEKRCTVYRYDRAGYGRSESRENGDSLLANARDLLEILRQIDPPVRVIAHSAGGAVAMKLAEIQPNAMAALLVFEPLIIQDLIQDADRRAQFQEISDLIQRTQNIYQAFSRFEQFFDNPHSRAQNLSSEEVSRVLKNCKTFFLRDYESFQEYLPDYGCLRQLPILIGCSSLGENTFRREESALLAERTSRPLVVFQGGHNAPFENPEAFASQWDTLNDCFGEGGKL